VRIGRGVGDGGTVISSNEGLVVLVGSSAGDSRTSVGGVVRRTDIMGRASGESAGACSNLRVAVRGDLVLATTSEETATTSTAGVVVGGAGTEALLLLVVARKSELDKGGDEEKQTAVVSRSSLKLM
jgi:hypothetical protein